MESLDDLVGISEGVNVGIDVGQRVDPTAICVAEVQRRDYRLIDGEPVGGERHYLARHVERLALGTSYPKVAERLREIYQKLKAAQRRVSVRIDATGVGTPVVDLMRAADVPATAVYLTGGEKEFVDGDELRLPKTLMVSRLQVLLQSRRIHLPDTPDAKALISELLEYEIKVTESANLQMGVFSTGKHDDLATALGLACWEMPDRTIHVGPAPAFLTEWRGTSQGSIDAGQMTYERRQQLLHKFSRKHDE